MGEGSHGTALFTFNDRAEVALTRIGRRGILVSRIHNVFCNPAGVAALGFSQSYAHDPSNLYPGIRAPTPESFSAAFCDWLTPMLQQSGALEQNKVIRHDASFFSVVTTASADLLPIQCIPHYDSTDPSLFAAVIYLCDSRFSGTSFYRHRRTGYEEITDANQSNYKLALVNDMRVHGAPEKEYMNGSNALFEAIFSNELVFNSAILYPGRLLHAANISRQFTAPKNQSEWRLTVTALLRALPD
jgi:hypothetical protein